MAVGDPLMAADETCKLPGDREKTLLPLDQSADLDGFLWSLPLTFQHVSFLPYSDHFGITFAPIRIGFFRGIGDDNDGKDCRDDATGDVMLARPCDADTASDIFGDGACKGACETPGGVAVRADDLALLAVVCLGVRLWV